MIERAYSDKFYFGEVMRVIPINFSTDHKKMLGHSKILVEKGMIAIDPIFDKLITSLWTAVDNEGKLDKESTSFNDIFDAFRLSLDTYHFI